MESTPTPPPIPTSEPMQAFMDSMTTSFPIILDSVVDACATIVGNPFLLFTVLFLFAGGVIGIIGRLLSRD